MASKGFELSPPTQPVWIVSLIVGILGIIAYFVAIPIISVYAFWFVVVAFVLLVLATLLKGL